MPKAFECKADASARQKAEKHAQVAIRYKKFVGKVLVSSVKLFSSQSFVTCMSLKVSAITSKTRLYTCFLYFRHRENLTFIDVPLNEEDNLMSSRLGHDSTLHGSCHKVSAEVIIMVTYLPTAAQSILEFYASERGNREIERQSQNGSSEEFQGLQAIE